MRALDDIVVTMDTKKAGAAYMCREYGITIDDVSRSWGQTRQAINRMHRLYPHRFLIVVRGIAQEYDDDDD